MGQHGKHRALVKAALFACLEKLNIEDEGGEEDGDEDSDVPKGCKAPHNSPVDKVPKESV